MSKEKINVLFLMKLLNALDLLGVALVLLVAIGVQVAFNELPCPLCLLQRLGLIAIGFGFLLNIYFDIRPAHYALSLLAAVFTGLVAFRQMLLHIVPGSGSYGDAILGLHLYTWVFVLSILAVIYISILLSWSAQYKMSAIHKDELYKFKNAKIKFFCHLAFAIFFFATLENVVSTLYECGLRECTDNPVSYILA